MTPAQRRKHKDLLVETIINFGFKEDRWGNYTKTCTNGVVRIKIKKVNIRIERKYPSGWYKIISTTYSKVIPEKLTQLMETL